MEAVMAFVERNNLKRWIVSANTLHGPRRFRVWASTHVEALRQARKSLRNVISFDSIREE
jgi:hypothetical protein